MNKKSKRIIVIGGGAAGFFAAINYAELKPQNEVIILERSPKVLSKVKISGGGRCNVTNACFNPKELVKFYPRGSKALLGAFNRFNPSDTIKWFERKNVKLKTEADNRIFPVTDDSQTIVDCFLKSAEKIGIKILTRTGVQNIIPPKQNNKWIVETTDSKSIPADSILIATGSNERMWNLLRKLSHKIVEPVPSLFTFNIKDKRISGLSGISFSNVKVSIEDTKLTSEGPLLITHWGMSGPAILKLSAFGARILHQKNYGFNLIVNWIPGKNIEQIKEEMQKFKDEIQKKKVCSNPLFGLPIRLWERLCAYSNLNEEIRWSDISKKQIQILAEQLGKSKFEVKGKSTFKEEFVTAGGVSLNEVSFKTMQSKIHPGLFFAGEVLDIDALTGGFNFQAAWTTGWIAANSM